jgi:hypothetical protein
MPYNEAMFNPGSVTFRLREIVYFVGFAYQGKDIVFRFIIEYSSLSGFGP